MSVRAEMVRAGLRWLIKHRNHRELTVEQHRRFVTVAERLVPDPPPHTRTLPVDADGVRADLIATPASDRDRHVLFLHGGAFIIGSPNLYRHLTWRIASAARAHVLAVDYRCGRRLVGIADCQKNDILTLVAQPRRLHVDAPGIGAPRGDAIDHW